MKLVDSFAIARYNPLDSGWGTSGGQTLKSPSVVLSTLPCCLPAIPLYFSFSKLCDLSVWGHERLITSVWTGLTVGRPCESFSHTLVPAGLGPGLCTAVILSSSGPLWSQSDPPWQTKPRFWERERERPRGPCYPTRQRASSGCLYLHSKTSVRPDMLEPYQADTLIYVTKSISEILMLSTLFFLS